MSQAPLENNKLDNLYLKFFKYTVIGLMTLALLVVVICIPMAVYQYLQSPLPPMPAKVAPERAINLDDFKKYLIEEEKRRLEQEKSGNQSANKQPVSAAAVSSLYAEQSLALQRCSEEFRTLAKQDVDTATEKELSDRRETQRSNIERLANGEFRGASWPNAMVSFVCDVLKNPEIAKLKQDNAIGAVVSPAIGFHARAWTTKEKEKFEFNQGEERRVQGEILAENARVAASKIRAVLMLSTAGGAFLFFMAMALYLIFAKIEANLALINQTITRHSVSVPPAG